MSDPEQTAASTAAHPDSCFIQGQNTSVAPTLSGHDSEGQPDAETTELRLQTARREALDACTKLQASMTSSAQQHEQRLAETQAEVQEATGAAQHAQAAEAEATAAADKAAASSAAVETARADATAAAQRCQQVFDTSINAINGARRELSTRMQHTIKEQILAAVRCEVTAATQQSPANWQSLQSVATDARKLLEGVDQEIRNSMDSAVQSTKAEIVSAAVEAAVAATAVQRLGAADQAGTSQGTWQRHGVPDLATTAKEEALHNINLAEQRALSSVDAKASHGVLIVQDAIQKGSSLLRRFALQNTQRLRSQPELQHPLMTSYQNQGMQATAAADPHQASATFLQPVSQASVLPGASMRI
ncbi:hypothetical protein WJX79_005224 [Trebouxia sp. C0005]